MTLCSEPHTDILNTFIDLSIFSECLQLKKYESQYECDKAPKIEMLELAHSAKLPGAVDDLVHNMQRSPTCANDAAFTVSCPRR